MAKKYIDAEAAINACYDGFADCRDDCADNIRKLPAADVVEIVRCGECVYSRQNEVIRRRELVCTAYGPCVNSLVAKDFYCAFGVKTEEEE